MKVDVGGFELEVFAGAKEILDTHQPIVFLEMNHWWLDLIARRYFSAFPDFVENHHWRRN